MIKVIHDLLDQNELLLQVLEDGQHLANENFNCLQKKLEKTANKTNKVGAKLTSFEHDIKWLVDQNIPEFVECSNVIEKTNVVVEKLEAENAELKANNDHLFRTLVAQNDLLSQNHRTMYQLYIQTNHQSTQFFQ